MRYLLAFFRNLWHGLDVLRRVLHLLLLLALLALVIAISNRGFNSSFTVRKVSHGEGVERTFQTHSPSISDISVKRRGNVRRAKLYYLRDRAGKSARIEEKV